MTYYDKFLRVNAFNCSTNTPITDIYGFALVYDQTYSEWHYDQLIDGLADFYIQGTYAEVYIVRDIPTIWPPTSYELSCASLTYPDGYIANPCMQVKSNLSTDPSVDSILNYCLTVKTSPVIGNVAVYLFKDNNRDGSYTSGDEFISSIYITLRDKSNNKCISYLTDSSGCARFTCSIGSNYEIYYTNLNINGVKTDEEIKTLNIASPINEYIPTTALNYSFTFQNTDQSFYMGFGPYNQYPCKPVGYVISGDGNSILYEIDIVTGTSVTVGPLNLQLNALAYNPIEHTLYAFDRYTDNLYRIESDAKIYKVNISNIPLTQDGNGYYLGTFDDKGVFYFKGNLNNIYKLNLNPYSPKYGNVETIATTSSAIQDFVWHQADNSLYSFEVNTTTLANSKMIKISPTGTKSAITTDLSVIPTTNSNQFYMLSSFKDYKGFIYFMSQAGVIYRATLTFDSRNNPVFAKLENFAKGFPSSNADGANCIFAQVLVDYGNAPENGTVFGTANYKSKLANNGPRHTIVENLSLGSISVDEDNASDSDGNSLLDNDGPTNIPLNPYNINDNSYTINVKVKNNTGQTARLYAWLDFNKDGIFNVNEFVSSEVPSISSGLQTVPLIFIKPKDLTLSPGKTFIRLRITTENLTPISTVSTAEDSRSLGPAKDGEVEDYILGVYAVPNMSISKSAPLNADLGDTFVYIINIENKGSSLAEDVLFKDPELKNLIDLGNVELLSSKMYIDETTEPVASFPSGDFINGYNLGDIAPSSKRKLEFEVKVLSCT
ncbi:MAG: DUF6923 family protein [Filifactoraceae bacterium]